jgi:M6 family metalloprotease-like protein
LLLLIFWVVSSGDEDSATSPTTTTAPEWIDEGFIIGEVKPCRLPDRTGKYGVNSGFPISADRLVPRGKVHVAVLFVDFPDAKARHGSEANADEYTSTEETFYEEIPPAEEYLEAMSYEALDLAFWPLHEWLRMDGAHSSYRDDSYRLVREAIALAGREFAQRIDSVVVFTDPRADLGPSHAPMTSGSIGPSDYGAFGASEQSIQNAVVRVLEGPQNWAGKTIAHELGHNLGLPDLYDVHSPSTPDGYSTDAKKRFVGEFDIMGGGSYEKLSSNEMLAWQRWRLGWIHDTQIACISSFPASVQITPVAASGGTKAVVVPLTETTALVVESRRQLGYDLELPEEGALVYTVDSTIPSGEGPIVVHGTSSGDVPDASVLLQPGESVTVGGYTVTVADATPEGEFIKVSNP